ncbi:MAG: 1-deoxy-D-xylulose-5-phosphate reductoisomerase [Calditrichaeota bacterium]|nr:MAG: 1-deoxy-D-xylulose-5-phosphate reductoisomerase [Calditrichota bacterium]
MPSPKRLVILGATGSIGLNCLRCVTENPDLFRIVGLSTHHQVDLLLQQCATHKPQYAAVSGRMVSPVELLQFEQMKISLFTGAQALTDLVNAAEGDMLVNAVVGAAGFLPTLAAIELGRDIALANKETLVIGGELVMNLAAKKGIHILPIDSEHSAVFQCLMGEDPQSIEAIILTASGGPFRSLPKSEFKNVTVERALAHPNWRMGKKITIDSATMMNKGFEVIEACRLFGVRADQVRVIIHPQSIIHSMVEFKEGSIKAQMGVPDMRIPIQLALTWPRRVAADFPRLDFNVLKELTFELPDMAKFRCLVLAYQALAEGGTAPAVLNAANEIAVQRFLSRSIRFDQIETLVQAALETHKNRQHPQAEELVEADLWARSFAENFSPHSTGILT